MTTDRTSMADLDGARRTVASVALRAKVGRSASAARDTALLVAMAVILLLVAT